MGKEDKRMQTMFDELKKLDPLSLKVNFIQFENQTHMSGRVSTVMAGLRRTFSNWRPSSKIQSGQLHGLQTHYKELSLRFGFEVSIPLETMKRESAFHCASNIPE